MDNKLINPVQSLIDAAAKSAASAPIAIALERHKQRASAHKTNDSFIVADISGSMNEPAGSVRKIDLLRQALLSPGLDFSRQRIVTFHSFAEEVSGPGSIPEPRGSTALHMALNYVADHQPFHVLLISDGHPDSKEMALSAADKINGKIDVLYIGPDNDHEAISFMYQLAGRSGGRVTVNDVHKLSTSPGQLTEKIQLLLK